MLLNKCIRAGITLGLNDVVFLPAAVFVAMPDFYTTPSNIRRRFLGYSIKGKYHCTSIRLNPLSLGTGTTEYVAYNPKREREMPSPIIRPRYIINKCKPDDDKNLVPVLLSRRLNTEFHENLLNKYLESDLEDYLCS